MTSRYNDIKEKLELYRSTFALDGETKGAETIDDAIAYIHKMETFITHLFPERFDSIFISGVSEELEPMTGMPHKVHISPKYGVDFAYIYELKVG